MQEARDATVSIADTKVDTYPDNNLNEKNFGTQYIYTTEGELIPADTSTPIDSQHFNTVHVTESQNIEIQPVEYQYEQQYSEDAVQQVVAISGTEFVADTNTFVMETTEFTPETTQPVAEEQFAADPPQATYQYAEGEQFVATEEADPTKSDTAQEKIAIETALDDESNIQSLQQNPAIEIEHDGGEESIEVVVVEASKHEDVTEEEEDMDDADPISASPKQKEVKTSLPRGRKPCRYIPMHIVGRDVNNPVEKSVNGKTPKPRLGVKVPYRNLVSQIVSKAEIEEVILERGKKKQEEKHEIQFVRQLTSRLAKKISSGDTSRSTKVKRSEPMEVETATIEDEKSPKAAINNDTDLLAILEGEGTENDEDLLSSEPEPKDTNNADESNIKNLEREIALQQLQDLPYLSPKTKFVKGNKYKQTVEEPAKDIPAKSSATKSVSKTQVQVPEMEVKRLNTTLKTYSRKRKSLDAPTSSSTVRDPSPPVVKKIEMEISTEDIDVKPSNTSTPDGVYMTKSSRVIKKKVIWDPDDESPTRQTKVMKPEMPAKPVKNDTKPVVVETPKKEIKAKQEKKVEVTSNKTNGAAQKKTTPVAKASPKPKKPRSEVDKLLGDEGAIKMLYDLKKSEGTEERRRHSSTISVERTFKDLAKKANQIKSDLVKNENTKSLRKKDGTPQKPTPSPGTSLPGVISRQKSKDSSRSTPPTSPAFGYSTDLSYLIRRRSSSSVSSNGGGADGSIEPDDTEDSEESEITERSTKRKQPTNSATESSATRSKKPKKSSEPEKAQKRAESRIGHYNTFVYKKGVKSITINLHSDNASDGYFTSELLTELTVGLQKISKEKDLNVILITSVKEDIFSRGLDYKQLRADKDSDRKLKAETLAELVRNFLQTLLECPKILVAAIQGECVGLAVTMLPLFDFVIASDDAQFSAPYSKLGCLAEGAFLDINPRLAAELFYTPNKLTADEACRRSIVSKLCWPEKYQETIKSTIASIAQASKQGLESNKKESVSKFVYKDQLDSLVEKLVASWTSTECQSNFEKLE